MSSGSFSGAVAEGNWGLVELADGGTAFFDEIGDLPPEMQVKLLRHVRGTDPGRWGRCSRERSTSASSPSFHRHVWKREVLRGAGFGGTLYYRLNVLPIRLPALRNRKKDIPRVDRSLSCGASARNHRLTPGRMAAMLDYDWPGNVRELQNSIERMVALNTGPLAAHRGPAFVRCRITGPDESPTRCSGRRRFGDRIAAFAAPAAAAVRIVSACRGEGDHPESAGGHAWRPRQSRPIAGHRPHDAVSQA